MEPWLVTLISVLGGGAVAFAARWLDRRRGVPSEVDAAIDSHMAFVVATLKERVQQLETTEAECKRQLAEQSGKVDDLEAQVNRLLLRIDGK